MLFCEGHILNNDNEFFFEDNNTSYQEIEWSA